MKALIALYAEEKGAYGLVSRQLVAAACYVTRLKCAQITFSYIHTNKKTIIARHVKINVVL